MYHGYIQVDNFFRTRYMTHVKQMLDNVAGTVAEW